MKTLRIETIEPIYVNVIPAKKKMEQGKIYISPNYKISNHLCLCGCGEECVLSHGENGWSISDDVRITITPSILQKFACKSHYIITNGKANFV